MSDLSPIDRARAVRARRRARKVMAALRGSGPLVGLRAPAACVAEVREMLEQLIERRPREARAAFAAAGLQLSADGPIGWRPRDERKLAWVRALDIAIAARCTHRCSHPPTIAVLPLGVLACVDCVVKLSAGRQARPGHECDMCGVGAAVVRTSTEMQSGLTAIAEVCGGCGAFYEGLPDA